MNPYIKLHFLLFYNLNVGNSTDLTSIHTLISVPLTCSVIMDA